MDATSLMVYADEAADGAPICLNMALSHLSYAPQGMIHRSDHGFYNTDHAHLNPLLAHNIELRLGAVDNCYYNTFTEPLINSLKSDS
jgi:hypothetical protein